MDSSIVLMQALESRIKQAKKELKAQGSFKHGYPSSLIESLDSC